jgi:predicted  nucleic acid-binding Zn-ribbon protein
MASVIVGLMHRIERLEGEMESQTMEWEFMRGSLDKLVDSLEETRKEQNRVSLELSQKLDTLIEKMG